MLRSAAVDPNPPLRKAALLAASSLTVMAGAAVAPALTAVSEHFQPATGPDERITLLVKLILTLPALCVAVLAPVSGLILDRLGRRPVLLASLVLYAVAGTSGLWLPTLPAILVGRAFLGIATAGVMTAATTLIGDYFTGPARARFMGLQSSFMAGGGVIFLLSSGALAELGWRWPFLVYAASLLVVPMVALSIGHQPTSRRRDGHAPAPVVAVNRGLIVTIYATSGAGLLLFYLTPTQVQFLARAMGYDSKMLQGAVVATSTVGATIAGLSYASVRRRLSFPGVFALSFTIWSGGYALVAVAKLNVPGFDLATLFAGMLISGLGGGLLMPNCSNWLLADTPDAIRGRVVGGMTASFFAGQFVSPIVASPLVTLGGESLAFAGGAVMAAAIAFIYLLVARRTQ